MHDHSPYLFLQCVARGARDVRAVYSEISWYGEVGSYVNTRVCVETVRVVK